MALAPDSKDEKDADDVGPQDLPEPSKNLVAPQTLPLWLAFVAVHLLLCVLALSFFGLALGDVSFVYKWWAELAITDNYVVGVDAAWVYPIVALLPVLASAALGFGVYELTWLGMIIVLDAMAFAVLIRAAPGARRKRMAAWWWLAFLALLGPIAVGRIDSVTVPLAIVAGLLFVARPRLATVLLTVAAWVKVWPVAVLATYFVVVKRRWQLVATAVATSLVILLTALALGSGMNVFSFVTEQTGRGLQVESPVSTVWLWRTVFGDPSSRLYYDDDMLTFQVAGPGVDFVSSMMTPLLALAVIVVLLIGVRAVQRHLPFEKLLPLLMLALVVTLIAFNKVGSPQFVAWLAVPIIVGLALQGRAFLVPAILAGAVALLTQLIYPYFYGYLLDLNAPMVAVLTVRNLLYFVILGWAMQALWGRAQSEV